METVYLISLIVGGFFVLLSIFGGGEAEADTDVDLDADVDVDLDVDVDADLDVHVDAGAGHGHVGTGLVDLLSVRALFLFAAFFGLTGSVLTWLGSEEPLVAVLAVLTGLLIGLGGNYVIKRFAYEHVSSDVSVDDLRGKTGQVLIPFEGGEKGKILLVARGNRLQLTARALDDETREAFERGEEVVVVRMDGRVAEVVKPT